MKIHSYLYVTLWVLATSVHSFAAPDASAESRVEQLEQRIRTLETKLDAIVSVQQRMEEATRGSQVATAVSGDRVTVGARGLRLESVDGSYRFRVGLLMQMDGRFPLEGKGKDTLDMRRVNPVFAGTLWNDLDFQIMPELAGNVRVLDAFVDYRVSDRLRVRLGNFKTPLGLEQLQSSGAQRLLENGYVTQLLPNRDMGVQAYGKLWNDKIAWKVGVFHGTVDGHNGSVVTNSNNSFDWIGSLHWYPFRDHQSDWLQGLGVGVAGSWGRQDRDASLRIRNQQQQEVLSGNDIWENGTQWRVNPQLTYYRGPLGVMAEYMLSSRELGLDQAGYQRYYNEAWSISVGYLLTGEKNGYGMIVPEQPFRMGSAGMGAWELVVRYTALRMDRALWDNALLGTQQPDQANGWGVAVNWHATENWKAIISYDYTDYAGGQSNGEDRKSDQAILSRLQLNF